MTTALVFAGWSLATTGVAVTAGPPATSLVSHLPTALTTAAPGASAGISVSSDGSYVAFASAAANLVPGQVDTNGGTDIFLYERVTGVVTLVSHARTSSVTASNGLSLSPAISSDGSYVAFFSTSTDLAAGQVDVVGTFDVFAYARSTGAVTLVSHTALSATRAANGYSSDPVISADGSFVAFQSTAVNLVAGQNDGNGASDVFLFERATGVVTLVSRTPAGASSTGNRDSVGPTITGDGGVVAFASTASNLAPGQVDVNGTYDVFAYQRATGAMTLVSHAADSAATTANGYSYAPVLSARGAVVAFHSYATNLVAGQIDTNATTDVFLADVGAGATMLVSRAAGGPATAADRYSFGAAISDDGRTVAFVSMATNLVAGQDDSSPSLDVFAFDRGSGAVALVSHVPGRPTAAAAGSSVGPGLSANGAIVVFRSTATNLVAGQSDANGGEDVFAYDRATLAVSLVSHVPAGWTAAANNVATAEVVSADGRFVVFQSTASNVVANQSDTNAADDVFIGPPTPALLVPGDFNGDRVADTAVFRPGDPAGWFVPSATTTSWGASGDVAAGADYDGDRRLDPAIYRPPTGLWAFHGSGGTDAAVTYGGLPGDVPVPADYDGDGRADLAVFRSPTGTWLVHRSSDGGDVAFNYGVATDVPVPADYDGDGLADVAVYRVSTGTWFVQRSSDGSNVGWTYGTPGDIPSPADYDGDGRADAAIYRPSSGLWAVHGSGGTDIALVYGAPGDVPVPADYDGDGRADAAVFRPPSGAWFEHHTSDASDTVTTYGLVSDVPVVLPPAIRRLTPVGQ